MVKSLTISMVVLGLIVALGVMVGDQAKASYGFAKNTYVYSVKFTCGQQSGSDDDVVTGVYRTNINVHNPQNWPVHFQTQVVLPDNATPTGQTSLVTQNLSSGHALFIDCYTTDPLSIASQLSANSPSITAPSTEFEGFVVIQSPAPLDVIGKYEGRGAAASLRG